LTQFYLKLQEPIRLFSKYELYIFRAQQHNDSMY
jgi:hypothetical protein